MLREAPGRVNHNIRSLHSEEREAVQAFLSVASMDFPQFGEQLELTIPTHAWWHEVSTTTL